MNKTDMYVVTHKQADIPKIDYYIPIIVGSNNVKYEKFFRDNVGDNIAEKNPNYCELTALYWIWKNVDSDHYVGFTHYRRFFLRSMFSKEKTGILTAVHASKLLKRYDLIMPYPITRFACTVKTWFLKTDGKEKDVKALRDVISDLQPCYLKTYDSVMNGYSASYLNMFVMPKSMLDDYCEWLFPILFELENRIDISGYTPLEARIYGFLSERLFNVWVRYNNYRPKYLHILQVENPLSFKEIFKEKLMYYLMKFQILKLLRRCRRGYRKQPLEGK